MAHKHRPILFSRKAWIFDPDEDPDDILRKVDEFACRTEKDAYEQIFANRSAAEFVYSSNLMERTLPVGFSEHATFLCLEEVFQKKGSDEICSSWNADGSRNQSEMKAQMVQHCRALQLVGSWSRDSSHRLSAESVCSLHKTLMHNATDADGSPLSAGEIRKAGAFTTGHIYPEASMARLDRAIEKYYVSLDVNDHFLISAAILFYEIIQAHPFQDGNGRLSRLLLSYALERAGFPFSVPLTSGHSKARKHYILAIQSAQNRDATGLLPNKHLVELIGLILKSCYYKIINYEANKSRMK
jgi:fido (protein-threonine AMPylation protein)